MFKKLHFIIFTLTTLFIFTACEKKTPTNTQPQAVEVGYISLKEQSIALQQELSGRVKAKFVSEIRPQISGIIKEQLFTEGSKVKQGDILYKIDSTSYQASYNQAKASLESAKAQIESSKLKVQRYEELLKFDGISKQELDDAKASYLQAIANVEEKKIENPKPEKKVEKSTPAPKVQPKKENTPKPEKNKTEGKNNGNGFNSKVY